MERSVHAAVLSCSLIGLRPFQYAAVLVRGRFDGTPTYKAPWNNRRRGSVSAASLAEWLKILALFILIIEDLRDNVRRRRSAIW